jgi:hypothetical protein
MDEAGGKVVLPQTGLTEMGACLAGQVQGADCPALADPQPAVPDADGTIGVWDATGIKDHIMDIVEQKRHFPLRGGDT